MVSAVIMAGGNGTRSGQSVPKQFLTVNDIPVIVYTMQNLQGIEEIEKIIVVGPIGWENFILTYAKQFGITKLEKVVAGGNTRNESIYNGLCFLKNDERTKKVCLIDANRPMVPKEIIHKVIELADECDCALAADPCYDSMFASQDGEILQENMQREYLYKGLAPECAKIEILIELYEDENAQQNSTMSTAALAISKGKKVKFIRGSIKCLKITTADDFELFKAFLNADSMNNII